MTDFTKCHVERKRNISRKGIAAGNYAMITDNKKVTYDKLQKEIYND